MQLNNGTKWGVGIGLAVGVVAIFVLGIDDIGAMGSACFFAVIGGAVLGTIAGMFLA